MVSRLLRMDQDLTIVSESWRYDWRSSEMRRARPEEHTYVSVEESETESFTAIHLLTNLLILSTLWFPSGQMRINKAVMAVAFIMTAALVAI